MTMMIDVVAISLRATPYGEADRIVSFYTAEQGELRAIAKGVKKPTAKLAGACEPLTLNQVSLAPGRNLYTVCHYARLESFSRMRADLERMAVATLCTDMVRLLGRANDPDSAVLYRLLSDTLYALDNPDTHWLVSSLQFHIQLLAYAGYCPDFTACVRCDCQLNLKDSTHYPFVLMLGGFVCPQCKPFIGDLAAVNVSSPTLQLFNNPANTALYTYAVRAHRFLAWYWGHRLEMEPKSFAFLFHLLDAAPA